MVKAKPSSTTYSSMPMPMATALRRMRRQVMARTARMGALVRASTAIVVMAGTRSRVVGEEDLLE